MSSYSYSSLGILYPNLVAIGVLFGYGIKAILIPVFVICEQNILEKKKIKNQK
jgi:hypothetical protein